MKHLAQQMAMKTAEKDEAVGEEDSFRKASQTVALELGREGGAAGSIGVLGTPVSGRGWRQFKGPAVRLGLQVRRTGIQSGRSRVNTWSENYILQEGLEG